MLGFIAPPPGNVIHTLGYSSYGATPPQYVTEPNGTEV